MAPLLARCLAALLTAAQADAGPTPAPRVVLLPPRVDPDPDGTLRAEVQAQLRLGLTRGRFDVADAPADLPDPCEGECLVRLRADTRADYLVRAAVAVNDRDYRLRLELTRGPQGELAAEADAACEVCGLREFAGVVADQGALLGAKIVAFTRAPPTLLVDTEPTGARVALDGVAVGLAPLELRGEPGKHRVSASLSGYTRAEREVELVPGVRESLRLSLHRSPRALRLRVGGWIAVAASPLLIGGGAALLAVKDRDFRGRCSGDDVDAEGDCRFVYTSGPLGLTFLLSGAVLGIVGAVLLARTRVRAPRPQVGLAGLHLRF